LNRSGNVEVKESLPARGRWFAFVFAWLGFLALASGCGDKAAPATLLETVDPVTVNGKAVHAVPTAPLSLAAGDTVEVGAKGLARLLYPDGGRFLLVPQGTEPASLQVTPRADGAGTVVVKLLRGVLAFVIPEKRAVKDRYELKALNTVTTIEGTAGRLITSPAKDSIALERGKVTFAAGAATQSVGALQEAVYDVSTSKFTVSAYDPLGKTEAPLYDEDVAKKNFTY
jgi:hypothetical protein